MNFTNKTRKSLVSRYKFRALRKRYIKEEADFMQMAAHLKVLISSFDKGQMNIMASLIKDGAFRLELMSAYNDMFIKELL